MQARDLLPPSETDSADVRTQRTRAAAVEAVLCAQLAGAPLRLSHQLVVLHALAAGHLDSLADTASAAVAAAPSASSSSAVHEEVARLLAHVEARMPDTLFAVDASGELDASGAAALLACAAEVLPPASGRAFFTNWDPAYAYDTSKATPVTLNREREATIDQLIQDGKGDPSDGGKAE